MALSEENNDTFYFEPFINDIGKLKYIAVISFKLPERYFTKEQKIFMTENHAPDKLTEPHEKVKWYRLDHSLKQTDISGCIGTSKDTYMRYEQGKDITLSPTQYDKLASLFNVPVDCLLDEYNKFLYLGQGAQIKEFRKSHKITQAELARRLSIQTQRLKRWEQGKNRMSKKWWEKLFKQP